MRTEARLGSCPLNRTGIVIHANGLDLPVYHVKHVDHGGGAERRIEIKDGGAPRAPVRVSTHNSLVKLPRGQLCFSIIRVSKPA
jgi:hypothetical protein